MSRIWSALKEAQQEKLRKSSRAPAGVAQKDSSDRRKSERRSIHVSLLLYGSDTDKQPFHEEAYTLEVNEDGCSLSLEAVVAQGQRLFLTNMQNQEEQECRVVHVGKRMRGKARIGVEFVRPAPKFWHGS
jgi:PilZ domain